jgi:transglutaminase-like putative cysteine protease
MKIDVSHRTTYCYRLPVLRSVHTLHLTPRHTPFQAVLQHNLLVNPAPVAQTRIVDYFGNPALLLRIEEEHDELIIHSRSAVDVTLPPGVDIAHTSPWEDVAGIGFRKGGPFDIDVIQFTCRSRHTPVTSAISRFCLQFFPPRRPVLAGAMDLTLHIFQEFHFDPLATDLSTPIERVLQTRRGVCQDFAHLAIAALRALGLPARYVSGYLLTRPPAGQPKLKGADASHAWLSVWAPETGWVDFDPTNGVMPSGEHVTVAWGRDYEDVCPISGVLLGGGDQRMTVAVDVESAT